MKDIYKRIFDKLPHKWEMVTLNMYINLQSLVPANEIIPEVEQLSNNVRLISILSNESEDVINDLPYKYILILSDKLKFLGEPVKTTGKSKLKFKSVDIINWDEYITINQTLAAPTHNFAPILSSILEDKTIDVGELNIVDVMDGFFLQQRKYRKLLWRSQLSMVVKLIWILMKEKVVVFWNKIRGKH